MKDFFPEFTIEDKPIRPTDFVLINFIDKYYNINFLSEQLEEGVIKLVNDYYNDSSTFDYGKITDKDESSGGGYLVFDYNSENHPVFAFCKLKVKSDMKVVFLVSGKMTFKIWINNRLLAIFDDIYKVYKFNLKKGENLLLLEFPDIIANHAFTIRLSPEEYENKVASYSVSKDNLLNIPDIDIFFDNYVFKSREEYKNFYLMRDFMLFIYLSDEGSINENQKLVVNIVDKNSNNIIEMLQCSLYSFCMIELSKLKIRNNRDLKVSIKYYNADNVYKEINIDMNIIKNNSLYKKLIHNLNILIKKCNLTDYDSVCAEYFNQYYQELAYKRINTIKEAVNTIDGHRYGKDSLYIHQINILDLQGFIEKLMHKKELMIECISNQSKKIYYKSKLDRRVNHYFIKLPPNYSTIKRYPLIITIATGFHGYTSQNHHSYKDIIFVDISQRGITTGSYVGEASILEVIEDIHNKFNIDELRIYLTGVSNGCRACWSLTQYYPHIFAGVIGLSGFINCKLIGNMYNEKIINISSEYEGLYSYTYEEPLPEFVKLPDFQGILYDKIVHMYELDIISFNSKVFKNLLTKTCNKYPDKIYFRTDKNRYLTAYWVRIHGIQFNYDFAQIQAEIKTNSINIIIYQCTGFTIELPPQLNKSSFSVSINEKQKYDFTDYTLESLSFNYINGFYNICYAPTLAINRSRKGTGLLDVYLDPLYVVHEESSEVLVYKTVARFAKPLCNGWDPNIDIEYPIKKIVSVSEFTNEASFIMISINSESKIHKALNNILNIKMDCYGFEYLDQKYNGEYCIMQITDNPADNRYSLLYIFTNNVKLLNKNPFTRQIILPSYASGFHKFLNNEALIYYKNTFYGVYEWGSKINAII